MFYKNEGVRRQWNEEASLYRSSNILRFIDVADFGAFPEGFDETDMSYWASRMPAWVALVKQSSDASHDTTIIYNNGTLLEAFLVPFNERINDEPQRKLIRRLNPEVTLHRYNENV